MATEKKEKRKVKKPSALKRDEQNAKRNLRNRSFKSRVSTAIRHFEDQVSQKDSTGIKGALDSVYSLMDKGVKKGIYKLNKANRVKSRFHAKGKRATV